MWTIGFPLSVRQNIQKKGDPHVHQCFVSCFEKPLNPAVAILFEFEQEFPFVASLGDVPDLIGCLGPSPGFDPGFGPQVLVPVCAYTVVGDQNRNGRPTFLTALEVEDLGHCSHVNKMRATVKNHV